MNMPSRNELFMEKGREQRCVRVVEVFPSANKAYVIALRENDVDMDSMPEALALDDFREGVEDGRFLRIADLPGASPAADCRPTTAAAAIRKERCELIAPLLAMGALVLDPATRGAAIAQYVREVGSSRNQVYKFLKMWWRNGQIADALLPDLPKCGGAGRRRIAGASKRGRPVIVSDTDRKPGVNVTPEVAAKIRKGIPALKRGKSMRQAYQDNMLAEFSTLSDGKTTPFPADERPTLGQFKYHVRSGLPPDEVARAVLGDAKYERKSAQRTGFSRDEPNGPGDIYQVDSTIANVDLKARGDADSLVGRPVLYFVTDQFSGAITGFEASLSSPSWDVIRMAFANAFSDKVESCRTLGLDIVDRQWPCRHVPGRVVGDRHGDILGVKPDHALGSLGVQIVNLPAYRPDLKPIAEGRFEWIDHEDVKWQPGATHGRKRGDRKGPPCPLDGHHDLDSFKRLIAAACIRHNETMLVRNPPTCYPMTVLGTPTPNALWAWGMENRGTASVLTPARIRACLLAAATGRESSEGLRFKRLHYRPIDPARWSIYDRREGRAWRSVAVRYDPGCVSSIMVPTPSGEFEEHRLVPRDKRYQGWSFEEVADAKARVTALDAVAETDRMQKVAWHHDATSSAVPAGPPSGGQAGAPAGRSSRKPDKEARRAEATERRSAGAWTHVAGSSAKLPPASVRRPGPAAGGAGRPEMDSTSAPSPAGARGKPNKLHLFDDPDDQGGESA